MLEAEQLIRQADHAMYFAKAEGRNTIRLFDHSRNEEITSKHRLAQEVERGILADEFRVFYQPHVDLVEGIVTGVEALVRWSHPERGLLAPGLFIPMLNGHPVLSDLGRWVMRQALTDTLSGGLSGTRPGVSVNIAPEQLAEEQFLAHLHGAVEQHQVPHGHLELEILETSAIDNTEQTAELIERCGTLGVSFALDDFGTGCSSLVHLQALPIRTIKIDQRFVARLLQRPQDRAILEAIITLARAFGLTVIAEGVETEDHVRLLSAYGNMRVQGYAIARPMPLDELESWFESWQPDQLRAAWANGSA